MNQRELYTAKKVATKKKCRRAPIHGRASFSLASSFRPSKKGGRGRGKKKRVSRQEGLSPTLHHGIEDMQEKLSTTARGGRGPAGGNCCPASGRDTPNTSQGRAATRENDKTLNPRFEQVRARDHPLPPELAGSGLSPDHHATSHSCGWLIHCVPPTPTQPTRHEERCNWAGFVLQPLPTPHWGQRRRDPTLAEERTRSHR